MAVYGLLCKRLRAEGFDVVADVIEKLRAERDALKAECYDLRRERDAICELVRSGDIGCATCKHLPEQEREDCELSDRECKDCRRVACACKECILFDKWEWSGNVTD